MYIYNYRNADCVADTLNDAFAPMSPAQTPVTHVGISHETAGCLWSNGKSGCSQRCPESPRGCTHAAVHRHGNERLIVDENEVGKGGDTISNR